MYRFFLQTLFCVFYKMHDSWSYGVAIVTIILLFVAAVLIAHQDRQHDNKDRLKRKSRPVLKLPLDFGALGL